MKIKKGLKTPNSERLEMTKWHQAIHAKKNEKEKETMKRKDALRALKNE